MEFFKKGQIVPKRLGLVLTHKKTQVNFTFGCDVSVNGPVITMLKSPVMSVIHCKGFKGRVRKNGTIQKVEYTLKKYSIVCQIPDVDMQDDRTAGGTVVGSSDPNDEQQSEH